MATGLDPDGLSSSSGWLGWLDLLLYCWVACLVVSSFGDCQLVGPVLRTNECTSKWDHFGGEIFKFKIELSTDINYCLKAVSLVKVVLLKNAQSVRRTTPAMVNRNNYQRCRLALCSHVIISFIIWIGTTVFASIAIIDKKLGSFLHTNLEKSLSIARNVY